MKEFFGLKCKYEDMSPVLIPAGYTRDYIDGKIAAGEQLKDVHEAFQVRAITNNTPVEDYLLLVSTGTDICSYVIFVPASSVVPAIVPGFDRHLRGKKKKKPSRRNDLSGTSGDRFSPRG